MSIDPDIFRKVRRQGGLTLLEVVVGLAILGLMAGAIYAIVMGSVESTAALAQMQLEDRRVETFLNRTRAALAHLPAGATVALKLLESEPMRQELTLRGVPDAFVWGANPHWHEPAVTLAPQPWPDDRRPRSGHANLRGSGEPPAQRFALGLSVPDYYRTSDKGEPLEDSPLRSRQGHQLLQPDQQGRFWLELLPEIDRIEWRFYDPAKKIWVDQHAAGRPPMIELRLHMPGRKMPVRALFATN